MSGTVAAIGAVVHSGWAATVVVGESQGSPRVLLRTRIMMLDEGNPSSKQPYHAAEALSLREAKQLIQALRVSAEQRASAAIEAIVQQVRQLDHQVTRLGIIDSSGRRGADLATILKSHALIHTADGDHFREALSTASRKAGVHTLRLQAQNLDSQAQQLLRRPIAELKSVVAGVGKTLGPPWTADQKTAALLAWMLLAR
jgi:hypothetical protein